MSKASKQEVNSNSLRQQSPYKFVEKVCWLYKTQQFICNYFWIIYAVLRGEVLATNIVF